MGNVAAMVNRDTAKAERSNPQEIKTDYKKTYEELKAKNRQVRQKLGSISQYENTLSKPQYDGSYGRGAYEKREGQRNRERILQFLADTYPNEKSNFELTIGTRFSRYSVARHCNELVEEGLVYQTRGKFGKYQLTGMALCAPHLQGRWLEKKAYDELITSTPGYTSTKTTTSKEKENMLSGFIATIGVYITYVIIEAALAKNFYPFIHAGISKKVYMKIFGTPEGPYRDNLIKTWVGGAIHPDQILLQLCKLVIDEEELNQYAPHIWPLDSPAPFECTLRSLFEENKTVFIELKKALTSLYPDIINKLGRIRSEQVPRIVDFQLKEYKKWKKRQKDRLR